MSEAIELLTALRTEWITQRDSWPESTSEHRQCKFAIYALDEAIHSLENGFVWRFHANAAIRLFGDKYPRGYGPLYRNRDLTLARDSKQRADGK